MQIFVKLPSSQTIALEVEPNDTIKSVQTKIRKKCVFPVGSQLMRYTTSEKLDDRWGSTLREYNIQPGSTLSVLVRAACDCHCAEIHAEKCGCHDDVSTATFMQKYTDSEFKLFSPERPSQSELPGSCRCRYTNMIGCLVNTSFTATKLEKVKQLAKKHPHLLNGGRHPPVIMALDSMLFTEESVEDGRKWLMELRTLNAGILSKNLILDRRQFNNKIQKFTSKETQVMEQWWNDDEERCSNDEVGDWPEDYESPIEIIEDHEEEEDATNFLQQRKKTRIFVRTLSGHSFALDVNVDTHIEHVQTKILEKYSTPSLRRNPHLFDGRNFLRYAGEELEDGYTLKDYNIQRGSTISLLLDVGCDCQSAKVHAEKCGCDDEVSTATFMQKYTDSELVLHTSVRGSVCCRYTNMIGYLVNTSFTATKLDKVKQLAKKHPHLLNGGKHPPVIMALDSMLFTEESVESSRKWLMELRTLNAAISSNNLHLDAPLKMYLKEVDASNVADLKV